jgi:hypothetical protein
VLDDALPGQHALRAMIDAAAAGPDSAAADRRAT